MKDIVFKIVSRERHHKTLKRKNGKMANLELLKSVNAAPNCNQLVPSFHWIGFNWFWGDKFVDINQLDLTLKSD